MMMSRVLALMLAVALLLVGPACLQAHPAHATHDHDHDHDHAIEFPLQRQRHMRFSVVAAESAPIAARISASAMVEPVPGRNVHVTAPARGVLLPAPGRAWPEPGAGVASGDVLAELMPLAGADDPAQLEANRRAATVRAALAAEELRRLQPLAEDGVVSARRLAEAQAEASTAEAELAAAASRQRALQGTPGERDSIPFRAPLAGTVIAVTSSPGSVIEAGSALVTILDASRVRIRVSLLAADLAVLQEPGDLRIRRPGGRDWLPLADARLVYRGIALEQGVLPLIYELDNDGTLPPGLPLAASVAAGPAALAVIVPQAAVLNDDGVDVVIVQLDAEHFERRLVLTGVRAAGWAAIDRGLQAGERVVVDGAYTVLLAGRAPEGNSGGHDHHGHSH